ARRRVHPLRHLERPPPLPGGPLRGGGAGAVRLGGADVLVRPPPVHEPGLTGRIPSTPVGATRRVAPTCFQGPGRPTPGQVLAARRRDAEGWARSAGWR